MMEKKACLTRPSATTLCPFPGVEPRWTLILLDPARDQEGDSLGFVIFALLRMSLRVELLSFPTGLADRVRSL